MASARWGSSMMALSVISRQKALASTPWRTRMSARRVLSSGSSRSRVDRLTDTRSARPWVRGSASRRATSSNIHSVSCRTNPVCSANGMNCMGGTRPRCGCCQRTRASAARPGCPCSGTLGCRYRRSSWCSTAWRSSVSSDRVCALAESNEASYCCAPLSLRLAAYMAISERLSSVSASSASPGQQAMPMPALRSTVWSSKASGSSNDWVMRNAVAWAVAASAPRSSTANSLPPRRATMLSGDGTCWRSRTAGAACNGQHHSLAKALPVGQAREAIPIGQAADLGLLRSNVPAHVIERTCEVANLVAAVGVFQRHIVFTARQPLRGGQQRAQRRGQALCDQPRAHRKQHHPRHGDDGQQHLQLPVGGEHFVHRPQQQRLPLAPHAVQANGPRQQDALGRLQLARGHTLALQQRQRAWRQRADGHLGPAVLALHDQRSEEHTSELH